MVGARLEGADPNIKLRGVASVADANSGDITFFGNSKYLRALQSSAAGVALVPQDFSEEMKAVPLRVENPSSAFAKVAALFAPEPVVRVRGIHSSAVIAPDATVGEGVSIGPNVVLEPGVAIGANTVLGAGCYVGHESSIGADSLIYPNVSIRERCSIGDRVIIHCGTVVGSDGFGFEFVGGVHQKIPQTGKVQIDDDVEIGANVTIDRARFGRTWIQHGTKIDNLVQIAHNVVIEEHALIVAQVGISGSSQVGAYAILAGQAGVTGHVRIGPKAIVAAQGGVSKDIPEGETWFGSPAVPLKEFKRRFALLARLGKLVEKVEALEARLAKLEKD